MNSVTNAADTSESGVAPWHLASMRPLLLCLLLGCPAADDASTDETSHTDATGDTEVEDTAITWQTLDGDCVAPDDLPDDPIEMTGQERYTSDEINFFVEFVDLHLMGDRIYGVGQGGLVMLDVSTPTPVRLGDYSNSNQYRFHRVEPLDEDTVVTVHRDRGLYVLDTSDVSEPTLVTTVPFDFAGIEGMAYDAPYLYVTSRTEGLLVFDVSEPSDPEELAAVEGIATTWELAEVADGWTYAADNDLELVPIDLSDPTSPVLGTPVDLGGAVLHVERLGDLLLASVGYVGLVVLSLEDPAAPEVLSTSPTGGTVLMAAGDGDLAVVVDHEAISAFDISDPTRPVLLGREDTEQFALAVELDGTQAWVGDWNLFSGFAIAPDVVAGDLDASSDELLFSLEGEVDIVTLSNRGAGPLTLSSVSVDDDTVQLEVSDTVIAPGDDALLRITWTPAEGVPPTLDATVCISTDDPDESTYQIALTIGDDSGPVGMEAPDFTLEDLDGELHNLREQLGTPVMLAYFATW